MKVLFSHSYFLKYDAKQWRTMQPFAPLATIYAASLLRENGCEVKLHDVMFEDGPEGIEHVLESFRPDIFVVYDDGFNYLTKMCLTNMREAAFKMAQMAKKHNCVVAVSSSDSTDHFDQYLDEGADYIIIGEAEQTLLELVNHVKSGKGRDLDIAGLATRVNGVTVRTHARPVMHDLDSLPFPAWDLIDVEKYRAAWLGSMGYFSINVATTRGCPFKCNWCAKPIYGNRYNARSPEHVVAELKMLKERYNFDHVWFCDDIFGLKPKWVSRFAELVKQEGLSFNFKIQCRADLLLNDEQIKPLADAGCTEAWMGAESGSQKILDAMDKGTKIAQIGKATELLKQHGIRPAFFLQFGYPGETIEDIRLTLEMLERLLPAEIGISVSYPLPGTKFYENVKANMVGKQNWSDSDDLALMFRNTYSPEFYKQLHRYVHARFRYVKTKALLKERSSGSMTKLLKLPYYNWLAEREIAKLNKIQPIY